MPTERRRYLAYMLRLWQVSSDRESIWRASLGEYFLHILSNWCLPEPIYVPHERPC